MEFPVALFPSVRLLASRILRPWHARQPMRYGHDGTFPIHSTVLYRVAQRHRLQLEPQRIDVLKVF